MTRADSIPIDKVFTLPGSTHRMVWCIANQSSCGGVVCNQCIDAGRCARRVDQPLIQINLQFEGVRQQDPLREIVGYNTYLQVVASWDSGIRAVY